MLCTQAMLLADTSEKLDPMSLLLYMSGLSAVLLLPAAIILEPSSFDQALNMVRSKPGFVWWLVCNCGLAYTANLTNFLVTKYTSALTLQVGGPKQCESTADRASDVQSYCMPHGLWRHKGSTTAAYGLFPAHVIHHFESCPNSRSTNTYLQVLGNMKGVVASGVSVAMFKNPVTPKGVAGYLVTVAGVVLYSEVRHMGLHSIHPPTGRHAAQYCVIGATILLTSAHLCCVCCRARGAPECRCRCLAE